MILKYGIWIYVLKIYLCIASHLNHDHEMQMDINCRLTFHGTWRCDCHDKNVFMTLEQSDEFAFVCSSTYELQVIRNGAIKREHGYESEEYGSRQSAETHHSVETADDRGFDKRPSMFGDHNSRDSPHYGDFLSRIRGGSRDYENSLQPWRPEYNDEHETNGFNKDVLRPGRPEYNEKLERNGFNQGSVRAGRPEYTDDGVMKELSGIFPPPESAVDEKSRKTTTEKMVITKAPLTNTPEEKMLNYGKSGQHVSQEPRILTIPTQNSQTDSNKHVEFETETKRPTTPIETTPEVKEKEDKKTPDKSNDASHNTEMSYSNTKEASPNMEESSSNTKPPSNTDAAPSNPEEASSKTEVPSNTEETTKKDNVKETTKNVNVLTTCVWNGKVYKYGEEVIMFAFAAPSGSCKYMCREHGHIKRECPKVMKYGGMKDKFLG